MAQTYSEFKTYLTSFVWRNNDDDLANDLDNIIKMANAELNRTLTLQRRELSIAIAPETEDYALPSDFYQMISLSHTAPARQRNRGEMRNVSKSTIAELRAATATASAYVEPYYYVQRRADGATLFLIGPFSAGNPGSFDLTYRTSIPDYKTEDASWVEDEYLDLYLYTVLKHVGMYLREDERYELYSTYANDALASALDEDLRSVKFGGSPLEMKPTRYIPRTKRQ